MQILGANITSLLGRNRPYRNFMFPLNNLGIDSVVLKSIAIIGDQVAYKMLIIIQIAHSSAL